MNIEAMRLWSRHDQGHASTYLSLEDARLIVEVYDYLCSRQDDWESDQLLLRMEGDDRSRTG